MRIFQSQEKKQLVLLYTIISLCAILAISVFYGAWRQYNNRRAEYIEYAKSDMEKMSKLIVSNLDLKVGTIDQLLRRVVEKQYTNLLFGRNLRDDVRHSISVWVNENVLVDAMLITDHDGKVDIVYSKDKPQFDVAPGTVFAVSELFQGGENDEKDGYFIHSLKTKDKNGRNNVIIGRKMEEVDGSFVGIVAAVVNIDNLRKEVESVVPQSKLSLLFDNDDLISSENPEYFTNDNFKKIIKNANLVPKKYGSVYVDNAYLDGKLKVISFSSIRPLPLTLVVVNDEKDFLSQWRSDMKKYYQYITLVLLIITALSLYTISRLKDLKNNSNKAENAWNLVKGKSLYFVRASDKLVTPVHAITGFAQMLSEGYFGQVNKEQKQRLNDIQQCSAQVLELIGNVSELISADVGLVHLEEEQVDMTSIIQGCIQLLSVKLQEQKISLIDNTMKNNIIIQADSRRVRHMILHVLSNAVQYTPAGGKIVVASYYDSQQNFVIEVSDSGDGIDKIELRRIQQPFDGDEEGEKDNKKISIGLPLCNLYANLHNGKLEIKSKSGSGTKIIITIPKQRVTEQRVQSYSTISVQA